MTSTTHPVKSDELFIFIKDTEALATLEGRQRILDEYTDAVKQDLDAFLQRLHTDGSDVTVIRAQFRTSNTALYDKDGTYLRGAQSEYMKQAMVDGKLPIVTPAAPTCSLVIDTTTTRVASTGDTGEAIE